jgi:hypothetical protein
VTLRIFIPLLALSASLFAQTRISAAANQITFELPTGFARPSPDILAKVFPNGTTKDMFRYSSVDGTIIFDLASSKGTASMLPAVMKKDEADLALDTRPLRWIVHEVSTFQGKPALHLDYIRTTADGELHHQAYYVLNNNSLIFFQFSISEKQAARFREPFQKSLASIRFSK